MSLRNNLSNWGTAAVGREIPTRGASQNKGQNLGRLQRQGFECAISRLLKVVYVMYTLLYISNEKTCGGVTAAACL